MTATRPSRTSSPVIAGSFSLRRLLALAKLLIDAGEGAAEAGEVRAALEIVDRVGVGEDLVVVGVVVLQRHVDAWSAASSDPSSFGDGVAEGDRLFVQDVLVRG